MASQVKLLGLDSVTQGAWWGSGHSGWQIAQDPAFAGTGSYPPLVVPAYPSYISGVTISTFAYGWGSVLPTGPAYDKSLEVPPAYASTRRSSAVWSWSTTGTVTATVTDSAWHLCSLYMYDVTSGRSQRLDFKDGSTVLDTITLSGMADRPVWLRVAFKNDLVCTITRLAGSNAILSAVVFDELQTAYTAGLGTNYVGHFLG